MQGHCGIAYVPYMPRYWGMNFVSKTSYHKRNLSKGIKSLYFQINVKEKVLPARVLMGFLPPFLDYFQIGICRNLICQLSSVEQCHLLEIRTSRPHLG